MRALHRPSYPAAPGWLTSPLAHRGLHAPGGPVENTLDAYAAARDAGFGVELDVHLSADRVPVLLHDFELPDGRLVSSIEQRDLPPHVPTLAAALDVHLAADGVPVVHHDAALTDGRAITQLDAADLPAHVPTLAGALEVLARVPVMVELKQEALRIGALERAVAGVLDAHRGPHCVASFHPASIVWFARERPSRVRVFTVTDQDDAPMHRVLRERFASLQHLGRLRPHAISFDVRGLPTTATQRWREDGGTLTTWTVRDAATLAAARVHADGMIFEGLVP